MRLFLLLPVLLISGCSWITGFAVTNSSDEEIIVTYGYNFVHHAQKGNYCPLDEYEKPEITNDSLSWWFSSEWVEAKVAIIDSGKCEATLNLKPGQSVMVTRKGTYTGHQSKYGKETLNLTFLEIESSIGKVKMNGWELLKRFNKIKTTLYAYEHK